MGRWLTEAAATRSLPPPLSSMAPTYFSRSCFLAGLLSPTEVILTILLCLSLCFSDCETIHVFMFASFMFFQFLLASST
jgi:hypothetical protein